MALEAGGCEGLGWWGRHGQGPDGCSALPLPPEAQCKPYYSDYSRFRLLVHHLCTSHYLDLFITGVIGLNVVTMAMEHYQQPQVGVSDRASGPWVQPWDCRGRPSPPQGCLRQVLGPQQGFLLYTLPRLLEAGTVLALWIRTLRLRELPRLDQSPTARKWKS